MPIRTLSLILILSSLCALLSCGSDDGAGPDDITPPVSPYPDDRFGLWDDDQHVMDQAAARYEELLLTMTPAAARLALIDEMNDNARIDTAAMVEGGTLISFTFRSGAFALLNTDELLGDVPEDDKASTVVPAPVRLKLHHLADKTSCGDVVTPPSRKVVIIAPIYVTAGYTQGMVKRIYEELQKMGWDTDDIDLRYPSKAGDVEGLTLYDMLDVSGYGMALYIGHGGGGIDVDGKEHYWIQGSQTGIDGVLPDSMVTRYYQWRDEGHVCVDGTKSVDGTVVREIYMKDTLFSSQMKMDEGAGVFFVTCNSDKLSDEMVSAGAGAVFSWDGRTRADSGEESFIALMQALSDPGSAASGNEALQAVRDQGLGVSPVGANLVVDGEASTFHLPVFPSLTTPTDCLPSGTDHVDVSLSYADCPELNMSASLMPGATLDLSALPPVPVDVEVRAVDAAGNTINAGLFSTVLGSNGGEIEICPCVGSIDLDLTDYPADGPYAATTVHIDLSHDDQTLGNQSFDLPLPLSGGLPDLIPGGVELEISVLTGDGHVLGTGERQTAIRCDAAPPVEFCVGWLDLEAGNLPAETADVVITHADPDAYPAEVHLAPGGQAQIYGFTVGGQTVLEAVALNGVGVEVGRITINADVECGANLVSIEFTDYGIVMTATPDAASADGVETVTITATLREWQETDVLQPTGDPVAGKLVEFDTTLGEFVGPTEVTSGADGTVSVELRSSITGVAEVRGLVMADLVESRPAFVNFDAAIMLILDNRSTDYQGDDGTLGQRMYRRCAHLETWLNDWPIDDITMEGEVWQIGKMPFGYPGYPLRIRISPLADCPDGSAASDVWLHYFYGSDYARQVTVKLLDGADPLVVPLDATVTLQDPWE